MTRTEDASIEKGAIITAEPRTVPRDNNVLWLVVAKTDLCTLNSVDGSEER
jgi:hypothetical protein